MSPLQSPMQVVHDWSLCMDAEELISHVLDLEKDTPETGHALPSKVTADRVRDTYLTISRFLEENKDKIPRAAALERLRENIKMVKLFFGNETEEMTTARKQAQRTIKSLQQKIKTEGPAKARLGAAMIGWQTRQRVVLPRQIWQFLDQHLLASSLDGVSARDVAYGLCREIEEMSSNPEKYQGKSVTVTQLPSKVYPFKVGIFPAEQRLHIRLNFDCRLEMARDGKSITLLIVPIKDAKLGKGVHKEIHRGQQFKISLRTESHAPEGSSIKPRKVDYTDRTVHKILDVIKTDTINQGMATHRDLFQKIGSRPGVRLAIPPEDALPTAAPSTLWTGPLSSAPTQEWYNADLSRALKDRGIPTGMSVDSPSRPFSMENGLDVLVDLSKTLEGMHQEGQVHRDVKPPNILVKMEGNVLHGYLTDFDFVGPPRFDNDITANYVYWDTNSEDGWITPFCDCYGLAICLAETMILGFYDEAIITPLNVDKAKLQTYLKDKKAVSALIAKEQEIVSDFRDMDFRNTNSAAEAMRVIDDYMATKRMNADQQEKFQRLKKRIQAVEMAHLLVQEVIQQDREVAQLLKYMENLPSEISGLHTREATINELSHHYYSAAEMSDKIQQIRRILS